jgi:hypothetical protein
MTLTGELIDKFINEVIDDCHEHHKEGDVVNDDCSTCQVNKAASSSRQLLQLQSRIFARSLPPELALLLLQISPSKAIEICDVVHTVLKSQFILGVQVGKLFVQAEAVEHLVKEH